MQVFIGVVIFAIVGGLIGWLEQDYLREQVRQFVTIRPYIETQFQPYVLTPAAEGALKPGNSFKECAKYCPEMVVVPPPGGGQFVMGSPPNEKGRFRNEGPQRTVTIARPFAVSKFEVTFDEWERATPTAATAAVSGTLFGSFAANQFSLHDMHGNVWEWVEDCLHRSYEGAPADGSAWIAGGECSRRVIRGGSWHYDPEGVRSI